MSAILIVDDDKDLVEGLRWYLEAEGYHVSAAYDGKSAIEAFHLHRPDVVVLDIMMPGMDGVQVCEIIRRESEAFILMLSARDGEIDKIRALSKGADDYVTKPFHVAEVVARIKALLRRSRGGNQAPTSYRWNALHIVFDERQVMVNEIPVDLTSVEFDLLVALVKHPKIVFQREQLIKRIWGEDYCSEQRLVDNHIYRLRDKLTKAGLENCPIITIRGVGYAFRPQD